MVGRYFRNSAQLETIPAALRNKVERIAAPLAQADAVEGWSLTERVQDAIELLEKARAHEAKLDDFLKQSGLFGSEEFPAETVALANAMQRLTPKELTAAMRQYAGDAVEAAKGEGLFGAPPTPEESFRAALAVPTKPAGK